MHVYLRKALKEVIQNEMLSNDIVMARMQKLAHFRSRTATCLSKLSKPCVNNTNYNKVKGMLVFSLGAFNNCLSLNVLISVVYTSFCPLWMKSS